MRLTTLGRIVGAVCLAGSLTYAAGGPATAAQPSGWSMTATPLPSTVHTGAAVAYQVTITNIGPSNISSLYLQTLQPDVPVFLDDPYGACTSGTSARLFCSFGALGIGSVTITVGYGTPGSGTSYDPGFAASTTGNTPTDKGHNSHGDFLFPSNNSATTLTSSSNFAGGFQLGIGAVSTGAVTNKNVQSTSVTPPSKDLIATAEDGLPDGTFTCPKTTCTGTFFGDWSRLKVRSVANFNQQTEKFPIFKVTLTVRGSTVSGTQSSIKLVHVLDDGSVVVLTQANSCTPTPSLNCLSVTKAGGNYVLTAYLDQNGGLRGSI